MKKILISLLSVFLILGLTGCSGKTETSSEIETEPVDTSVRETDHIKLKGVYVNNGYEDKNSSSIKMVYVFYTVDVKDANTKVSSKLNKVKINDVNQYESEKMKDAGKFIKNYYYSNYLEEIYVGDSLDVMSTFKIPQGDLEVDREFVFTESKFSEEQIKIKTDEIVVCNSEEEIAEKVDPEGYNEIVKKYEVASDEDTKYIRSLINGYYFSFFVNSTSYKLEFSNPDKFDITAKVAGSGMTNSGTYVVKNGFISLSYDGNETFAVEIPYEIENDDIVLYCADAFDVN